MKEIVELFIEDRMWPDYIYMKPEAGKKQDDWDRFSTNYTMTKHIINVNISQNSLFF